MEVTEWVAHTHTHHARGSWRYRLEESTRKKKKKEYGLTLLLLRLLDQHRRRLQRHDLEPLRATRSLVRVLALAAGEISLELP